MCLIVAQQLKNVKIGVDDGCAFGQGVLLQKSVHLIHQLQVVGGGDDDLAGEHIAGAAQFFGQVKIVEVVGGFLNRFVKNPGGRLGAAVCFQVFQIILRVVVLGISKR